MVTQSRGCNEGVFEDDGNTILDTVSSNYFPA